MIRPPVFVFFLTFLARSVPKLIDLIGPAAVTVTPKALGAMVLNICLDKAIRASEFIVIVSFILVD